MSSDKEQAKDSGQNNISHTETKSTPKEAKIERFSESSKGVSLKPIGSDATNPFTQGPQPESNVPQPSNHVVPQQAQPPAAQPTSLQAQPSTSKEPKASPVPSSDKGDATSDK